MRLSGDSTILCRSSVLTLRKIGIDLRRANVSALLFMYVCATAPEGRCRGVGGMYVIQCV